MNDEVIKYPYVDEQNGLVYFNQDTLIVTNHVEIRWNPRIKKHYVDRGYVYTNMRDVFTINIQDLLKGSEVRVEVICPICQKQRSVFFHTLTKADHSKCNGCAHIKDLSRLVFTRWTVIEMSSPDKRGRGMCLCKCECGNEVIVQSNNLQRGLTKSCGCLFNEMIGENHHRWNPDLTEEERANGRNYPELRQWRDTIKSNDDYTCQSCNERGGKLVSHHLNNYSDFPDKRVDLENGVTLCKTCHYEFHNWMGNYRVKCTHDDFTNFCHEFYLDALFLTK